MDFVRQYVAEHHLQSTVHLLGRHPAASMPAFFRRASVLLVSLRDNPLFNLYAPAKLSSYMAAGRPVIACMNGEGRDLVDEAGCGWTVAAGEANALAKQIIVAAASRPETLRRKGQAARAYYERHFQRERQLERLDNWLGI